MIELANYRLLDFGNGRKLEQIDHYVIDRLAPAATRRLQAPSEVWSQAHAKYGDHGWEFREPWPAALMANCGDFSLPLVPKPFGHIGIFPEQAPNWQWLSEASSRLKIQSVSRNLEALNLFGYTGASTLALAVSGVSVTHIDASKPSVTCARASLAFVPQTNSTRHRLLVEDAPSFVAREKRRGRKYDILILDPPAYGHGPNGTAWRLERDLWPLLEDLSALANDQGAIWLITGHSPEVDPAAVLDWFSRHGKKNCQQGATDLIAADGGRLNAGWFVRVLS